MIVPYRTRSDVNDRRPLRGCASSRSRSVRVPRIDARRAIRNPAICVPVAPPDSEFAAGPVQGDFRLPAEIEKDDDGVDHAVGEDRGPQALARHQIGAGEGEAGHVGSTIPTGPL